MAQRQKDKNQKVADEEPSKAASASDDASSDPSDDSPSSASGVDESADQATGAAGETDTGEAASGELAAEGEESEDDAIVAAGQLGTERYVLAGFFAFGMLAAYVLGRAIQTLWSAASNKDWFSHAVPRLAAVSDEEKSSYGLLLGGVLALVLVLRVYRRSDVRTWTDDVASELAKVKWPTRKEVSNSTVIVIAASTVATLYLALLDRLWAFVTNIVYGDGS
jgi:preprotein translocase subunit SecE